MLERNVSGKKLTGCNLRQHIWENELSRDTMQAQISLEVFVFSKDYKTKKPHLTSNWKFNAVDH